MSEATNTNDPSKFWWNKKKGEDLASSVEMTVKGLKERQNHLYEANKRNLRLVGQHQMLGLRAFENSGMDYLPRLTLNVVQQCVDTAQARIAKNKPRPRFLTEGGNYTNRRKGEKMGKFIEGVYHDNRTYSQAQRTFFEAGVFGTGAIKIYPDFKEKKIKHETVFIHEVVVDEDEAVRGKPNTMYQRKYINKFHLADLYPKLATQILQQTRPSSEDDFMVSQYDSDIIICTEAWRLPVNGSPGRHTISTGNVSLVDEPYKRKKFPFEFFRFRPKVMGFFGQGIAEINMGIQIEINKLLRTIQLCLHLGAIPKIWINKRSDVPTYHLNNKIGGIIKFSGEKPTSDQLMKVPPELFLQLNWLYDKAFEQVGLNQLSTTGKIPAGLNAGSGKALREYNDIESERFSIVAQDYEDFHVRIWEHTLELSEELAKEYPDFAVTSLDKNGIEKITWKDVQLEKEKYTLQVYPVNMLSKDPAGKLADIEKMMEMGLIGPEDGMGLLDWPDLNKFYKIRNARRFDIEMVVENIIEHGKYEPPSPLQDLEGGMGTMQNLYLYYKNEGLEPEKLELFTRWISDAIVIIHPPALDTQMVPGEEVPIEEGEISEEELLAEATPEELALLEQAAGTETAV